MRFPRRLLDSDLLQGAIAATAAGYLRLVHGTTRWRRLGIDEAVRIATADGRSSAVACFWHGRMLMMPFARTGPFAFSILISGHRDGRLIARTVARLGIDTIVGSSTRGGTAAALDCIERLRRGNAVICITPDGPRGPLMHANPGAVEMARAARVMLVPVSYGVTRRRLLRSWDRFIVPLPFGRGVIMCGEPIEAVALESEAARALLEQRLNAITAEADRLTGHAPIAVPSRAAREEAALSTPRPSA
jgi:lysophospholipid acyltransferase (LPLAT)-like uncharacterized protein